MPKHSMPWVGFKALPAGYVATSPWSITEQPAGSASNTTSAKAAGSGLYTFWQDPNALEIGTQTAPTNAASMESVQDCVTACDYDGECVGVTVQMTVQQTKIGTTCKLIKGDARPGRFKRTVVRTDLERIAFPTAFLVSMGWPEWLLQFWRVLAKTITHAPCSNVALLF